MLILIDGLNETHYQLLTIMSQQKLKDKVLVGLCATLQTIFSFSFQVMGALQHFNSDTVKRI